MTPPDVWDGTEAARMLLSCIYRVRQHSGIGFGSGHIMDIVRGKKTEKVEQFGHHTLSTFGVGAAFSEVQLRAVLRQLLALGAVSVDAQAFNTLQLTDTARAVLKGDVAISLRVAKASAPAERKAKRGSVVAGLAAKPSVAEGLDAPAQERLAALRAWRSEVARSHNLPAYVIFHDATLAAVAARAPTSLDELDGISGIGAKKREAYGHELLAVLAGVEKGAA